MFEDLRGFLTHLESQKQLLRVRDEVDVKYEIAAGMRKTSDIEGPALLFENIRGYRGWRVVGACFVMALFAWGVGFYGHSVYLAEFTIGRGWSSAF